MAKQFKGDIDVCRTGVFARRADEGLRSETITGAEALERHSAAWQRLSAAANQNVILPDATTLPNGWKITIESSGAAQLQVQTNDTANLQAIASGNAYEFTLLDNGSAAGNWYPNLLESASIAPSQRYTESFDATTSWGSAVGGFYTITVTEATHGRGTSPIVQIYEESGSDFIEVGLDELKTLANGDVEFRVPEDPDCRFAGRVVLV
jgi:hypothetical protein